MYHFAHCTHHKDCMHTTVDGADQTAFGLPDFNQDDKCTSEGLKYKVSITHLCPTCTAIKLRALRTVPCHHLYLFPYSFPDQALCAITYDVEPNTFMFSWYLPGGTNVTVKNFHW